MRDASDHWGPGAATDFNPRVSGPHDRKEANRCADLAKTAQLDFLSEIYRMAAVRYVLMAEEAERPDPVRGGRGQDGVSLWDRAEQLLAQIR